MPHLATAASLEALYLDGMFRNRRGAPAPPRAEEVARHFLHGTVVTRNGLIRLNKDIPGLLLPDDPADVKLCRVCVTAASGWTATATSPRLVSPARTCDRSPSLGPALQRLRHVRSLGTYDGADQVLNVVKSWTMLEGVDLNDVSDRGLASLEGMQTLKSLRIYSRQVTDAGVKSIGKLKNLEELTIEDAQITDACMKDIASLPKLKKLDLRGNPITDRGLAELKGMKLESLDLRSTKITDRGIDHLKDMTTLKLLQVHDTKVTKRRLPGSRAFVI